MLSKEDKLFLMGLADELSRSVATRTEIDPNLVEVSIKRMQTTFKDGKTNNAKKTS